MKKAVFVALCSLVGFVGQAKAQSGYYEFEHFDGTFTNPEWYITRGAGPLQWPADGFHNQALRLEDCASASASSHCTTSPAPAVQDAAVYICEHEIQHAGYKPGTGTVGGCIRDGNGMQEETWYRYHIRLAPGFLATPGTQNSIMEFHLDDKTAADAKSHGETVGSTEFSIIADGSCPGSPAYCSIPGTNPRLFIQIPGGPLSCGSACSKRFFPFASNSLLIDHWYDMVLHVIWSPVNGHVQWWVDGTKMLDVATPTEYVRSDGTWSYAESMGLYNNRHWANWASSVDGDEFIWGPTSDSIGFNPGGSPPPPPNPPTSLSSTDKVTATATVNWNASSSAGVTGYNVYRTQTSGSGYVNVGTTAGLAFTDMTVLADSTYFYVVRAIVSGVEGGNSPEIQVVIP
jgi:hypothetical protein